MNFIDLKENNFTSNEFKLNLKYIGPKNTECDYARGAEKRSETKKNKK